jgi:hypothetical protein
MSAPIKKLSFYNNKFMYNDAGRQQHQQEVPMPFPGRRIAIAFASATALSMMPFAANALPSTAIGQVSVAQVMEMISEAESNSIAKQVLVAYVAGVGESAGSLLDTMGKRSVSCNRPFSLDTVSLRKALETSAPAKTSRAQTPATPIIVADMIRRAGCRMQD